MLSGSRIYLASDTLIGMRSSALLFFKNTSFLHSASRVQLSQSHSNQIQRIHCRGHQTLYQRNSFLFLLDLFGSSCLPVRVDSVGQHPIVTCVLWFSGDHLLVTRDSDLDFFFFLPFILDLIHHGLHPALLTTHSLICNRYLLRRHTRIENAPHHLHHTGA